MGSDRPMKAARDQRGFALISALVLVFLFFSLVGLLMVESTAVLRAAQHFRARIVAQDLAESGAELAAQSMSIKGAATINTEVEQGQISGKYELTMIDPSTSRFVITGTGRTVGVDPMTATVKIYGLNAGGRLIVQQTEHSQ